MKLIMGRKEYIINEEFRMKVVNFLKIYGYYNGCLSKIDIERKYVSGELLLQNIIQNKHDFKELKMSINKVLEYCYENHFEEIEHIMNYFYKVECLEIRKKYGNFFDRH